MGRTTSALVVSVLLVVLLGGLATYQQTRSLHDALVVKARAAEAKAASLEAELSELKALNASKRQAEAWAEAGVAKTDAAAKAGAERAAVLEAEPRALNASKSLSAPPADAPSAAPSRRPSEASSNAPTAAVAKGRARTETSQKATPKPTLKYVFVQEFGESYTSWRKAFAEVLTLARISSAWVVLPCVQGGRLRTSPRCALELEEVFDMTQIRAFHPRLISYQDYMAAMATQSMPNRTVCLHVSSCRNLGVTSPSLHQYWLLKNPEDRKRVGGGIRMSSLASSSGPVLVLRGYRHGGFLKLDKKMYWRALSATSHFAAEHYQHVTNLLTKMNVSQNEYTVFHWRSETKKNTLSCAQSLIRAKQLMGSPTDAVLVSDLNADEKLLWSGMKNKKNGVPKNARLEALQLLYRHGFKKIDTALASYNHTIKDMLVVVIWDIIIARRAKRVATCSKCKENPCKRCAWQGNFAAYIYEWRRNRKLNTLKCWPSGHGKDWPPPIDGTHSSRPRKTIVHLHIGKSGGTSVDQFVGPSIRRLGYNFVGNRHFDWSYIDTLEDVSVITMLRDPVDRAISHFHFAQTLNWTRGLPIRGQTLSQYLQDPQGLLDTRDVWQDGQAMVAWLSGTHIASWAGIAKSEIPAREKQWEDIRSVCRLAARRLRETVWFGMLDDIDRSMELLTHVFDSPHRLTLGKSNANRHATATDQEKETLQSLMPADMWLFRYARLLFEARWKGYKTGEYAEPSEPPLPSVYSCVSTRFSIDCADGPLKGLHWKHGQDGAGSMERLRRLSEDRILSSKST